MSHPRETSIWQWVYKPGAQDSDPGVSHVSRSCYTESVTRVTPEAVEVREREGPSLSWKKLEEGEELTRR